MDSTNLDWPRLEPEQNDQFLNVQSLLSSLNFYYNLNSPWSSQPNSFDHYSPNYQTSLNSLLSNLTPTGMIMPNAQTLQMMNFIQTCAALPLKQMNSIDQATGILPSTQNSRNKKELSQQTNSRDTFRSKRVELANVPKNEYSKRSIFSPTKETQKIDVSSNKIPRISKMRRRTPSCIECVFCKNNGSSPDQFQGHILKDPEGNIICPVLRRYNCPICHNGGGNNAHTIRYCPLNRPNQWRRAKMLSSICGRNLNETQFDTSSF